MEPNKICTQIRGPSQIAPKANLNHPEELREGCRVLDLGNEGHIQDLGITSECIMLTRATETLRLREQQKHALALAPENREPKAIKPAAQDSLSDLLAKHTLRQSDPEKCP